MSHKKNSPEVVEITVQDLEALLKRLEASNLTNEDKRLIKGTLQAYSWLKQKYQSGKIGLHKLARLLFGNSSEKRSSSKPVDPKKPEEEIACDDEDEESPAWDSSPSSSNSQASHEGSSLHKKAKGHGRLGANDYPQAETVTISHLDLKSGDFCPEECGGKLYSIEPGILLRITGQDFAKVTRYHIEKLRCNTCGVIVKASVPEQVCQKKYDERFKAVLTVQKYFAGVPFYRQERFQELVGFPIPDSTQWELIEQVANSVHPIMRALEKVAACGEVIHNDDTPVKIMEVIKANRENPTRSRTGMFTTGIYALSGGHKITLYYSGTRHAGENLSEILKHRPKSLKPIIHMSDALAANLTDYLVNEATCMSHGRRKFIELEDFFPEECRFVIEQFGKVYYNDAQTKKQGLSDRQRLVYHQHHSRSVMKALKKWLDKQAKGNEIEPNSSLGKAIAYLRRHWKGLTLFLRKAGAPLDNNVLERALKLAIRLRKNSLIHRTCHGANVGSMLMSIIETSRLAGVNVIDYLIALQVNKSEVFKDPSSWLPWCYEETLKKKSGFLLKAS